AESEFAEIEKATASPDGPGPAAGSSSSEINQVRGS
ncbi:hypothetical protein SAMN04488692_102176, partial [Halarsenatibacter silvermanii]